MSAQNKLKKAVFSSSIRGYSKEEVDAYIRYANERYRSVCAENNELKRKITKLMLGIGKPDQSQKQDGDPVDPARALEMLEKISSKLDEESASHTRIISDIRSQLTDIKNALESGAEAEEADIADPYEAEMTVEPDTDIPEETETAPSYTYEEPDEPDESEPEKPVYEAPAEGSEPQTNDFEEATAAAQDVPADVPEEEPAGEEEPPEDNDTKIDLDFYTDEVHEDGESYDTFKIMKDLGKMRTEDEYRKKFQEGNTDK